MSEQPKDQSGVLRVLRTREEARVFYNKIARVYGFLREQRKAHAALWIRKARR